MREGDLNMRTIIPLGCIAAALTACSSTTETPDFSDTFAIAANHTATFDDGVTTPREMLYSDVVGEGISGFLGLRDGTIQPVTVRVSEDGTTAYVSFDGGAETAYSNRTSTLSSGGGRWEEGVDRLSLYPSTTTVSMELVNANAGNGFAIQQTPDAELLTGTVTYTGSFVMYDQSGSDTEGYIGLNVDFAGGGVNGNLIGTTETTDEDSAIVGTIAGQMDGGTFAGQASSTGTVLFSLEMLGAVHDSGNALSGAMAGTLDGVSVGGQFELDNQGSDL